MANTETDKTVPDKLASRPLLGRRRQLEHDLEHITQEMYLRNHELVETNKTLSLLRTIDGVVLQSQAPIKGVCEQIARAITDVTGHPFVGILTRSPHFEHQLELFGWSAVGGHGLNGIAGLAHVPRFDIHSPWLAELGASRLITLDSLSHAQIAASLGSTEKEIDVIMDHLPLKSLYLIKLVARH
ncbi:MAG TPA: hypothetical protein VLG37_03635, partial [Candidatus Saccharimonadales bacterium]|nr:hypothetical protein [Candidatus Saccharimonadales bacterium]